MSSPLHKAKDLGYSDEEIYEFLSKKHPEMSQKLNKAKEFGYRPEEIYTHFENQSKKEEKPESKLKSLGRTVAQPIQGFLEATTPGIAASFWQLLAMGEVFDPEAIDNIRMVSEREGVPFDEDAYLQAADAALKTIPTVSNIAREVESRTGLPLEAKEGYQKAIRLGTSAGKLTPGSLGQKALSGTAAGVSSESLKELGVPEPIADIAAHTLGRTTKLPNKVAKTHPSGLPSRKFENLKEPTPVFQGTKQIAEETAAKDFKSLVENIHEKSNKYLKTFREDPHLESEISDAMNQLKSSASRETHSTSSSFYQDKLREQLNKRMNSGFESLGPERQLSKEINRSIKEVNAKPLDLSTLIEQYRKNNKFIRKYNPFGPDAVSNEVQRDALLIKNRAIADVIEEEFSHVPEAQQFKSLNESYAAVQKAKTVDKFVDSVFPSGKFNAKALEKAIKPGPRADSLQNALGKEQFKAFQSLSKDMLKQGNALKMLKSSGHTLDDLSTHVKTYLFLPWLAKTKFGLSFASKAWRTALSDPEYIRDWSDGLKLLKKGKVPAAISSVSKIPESEE